MMKSGLDDIESTLTNVKQQLCTHLKLVQIAGKRTEQYLSFFQKIWLLVVNVCCKTEMKLV